MPTFFKQTISLAVFASFIAILFTSCDDYETYADQKERERNVVSRFIENGTTNVDKILGRPISVISEGQFHDQGDSTSVEKNEYVLFGTSGVYMQIVHKGKGEILKKGESASVIARFTEFNILADSVQLTSYNFKMHYLAEKFNVTNTSGTFTASFDKTSSVMYSQYGSASVPAGWLVPLTYVPLFRLSEENEQPAHVRLIVPHDQGHAYASSGVYPCYYDIELLRGI